MERQHGLGGAKPRLQGLGWKPSGSGAGGPAAPSIGTSLPSQLKPQELRSQLTGPPMGSGYGRAAQGLRPNPPGSASRLGSVGGGFVGLPLRSSGRASLDSGLASGAGGSARGAGTGEGVGVSRGGGPRSLRTDGGGASRGGGGAVAVVRGEAEGAELGGGPGAQGPAPGPLASGGENMEVDPGLLPPPQKREQQEGAPVLLPQQVPPPPGSQQQEQQERGPGQQLQGLVGLATKPPPGQVAESRGAAGLPLNGRPSAAIASAARTTQLGGPQQPHRPVQWLPPAPRHQQQQQEAQQSQKAVQWLPQQLGSMAEGVTQPALKKPRLGGLHLPPQAPPLQARSYNTTPTGRAAYSAQLPVRQPLRNRASLTPKSKPQDAAAADADAAKMKQRLEQQRAACIASLLVARTGWIGQVPEASALPAAHWAHLQRCLEGGCRGPVDEALNALSIYSFTEQQQPTQQHQQHQKQRRDDLDLDLDPGPQLEGGAGCGGGGPSWSGCGVRAVRTMNAFAAWAGADLPGPVTAAADAHWPLPPCNMGSKGSTLRHGWYDPGLDLGPAAPAAATVDAVVADHSRGAGGAGGDGCSGGASSADKPPHPPCLYQRPSAAACTTTTYGNLEAACTTITYGSLECTAITYDSLEAALRAHPGILRALWGLVGSALSVACDADPAGQWWWRADATPGKRTARHDDVALPDAWEPSPSADVEQLSGGPSSGGFGGPLRPQQQQEGCWWEQAEGLLAPHEHTAVWLTWANCAANVLRNLAAAELVPEQLLSSAGLERCAAAVEAVVADPNSAFNELAATLLELLTALAHRLCLPQPQPQPPQAAAPPSTPAQQGGELLAGPSGDASPTRVAPAEPGARPLTQQAGAGFGARVVGAAGQRSTGSDPQRQWPREQEEEQEEGEQEEQEQEEEQGEGGCGSSQPYHAWAAERSCRRPPAPRPLLQGVVRVVCGSSLALGLRTRAAGLLAAWLANPANQPAALNALAPAPQPPGPAAAATTHPYTAPTASTATSPVGRRAAANALAARLAAELAAADGGGPLCALEDLLAVDDEAALAAARREAAGELGFAGVATLADGSLPPHYLRLLGAWRQADAVAAAVELLHSLACVCGPPGQQLLGAQRRLVRHLVGLAAGHEPKSLLDAQASAVIAGDGRGDDEAAAVMDDAVVARAVYDNDDPVAARCRATLAARGDVAAEALAALAGGGVAAARGAVRAHEERLAVHVMEGGPRAEALAAVLAAL